jgi:hypothetical protein
MHITSISLLVLLSFHGLRKTRPAGSFAQMQQLARFLQFVGLTIPPLAMFAQLANHISVGKMLQFLLVSVGIFVLGYILQRYSK